MPEDKKNLTEEKEKEKISKITETEDGGVEVSVEEETPETTVEEKKEEEKKEVSIKQDPLKNKVYAHDRILANVQKSIEELKNIMLENSPSSKVALEQEVELDELDKLAQKDWKAAVSKLAEAKTKELLNAEKRQIEEERYNLNLNQLMEQNSQTVLNRHPELADEDSEKSQIFQDILNKTPRWRTSPDGPLLTMNEMENELRGRGYDVDGAISKSIEAEKNRLVRTTAATLPSSRTILTTGNKVVLTREQKEFCDQNGISYEEYARTLKKSGDKGGIEI